MTDPGPLSFQVLETGSLPETTFAGVKAVFAENYREADLAYLEKNLGKLRFIAMASTPDGVLAGFALGETRVMDLPKMPETTVTLAGLCCVGVAHRRQGLFGKLAQMALRVNALPEREYYLSCGRTAHPASFRGFFRNPSAVPRPGVTPSEWQQEVGMAVAVAYGSPGFDSATFVVRGSGKPIGWPVIEIEASPEEWEMFEKVDRSKGESLLGIAWRPDPPSGWIV